MQPKFWGLTTKPVQIYAEMSVSSLKGVLTITIRWIFASVVRQSVCLQWWLHLNLLKYFPGTTVRHLENDCDCWSNWIVRNSSKRASLGRSSKRAERTSEMFDSSSLLDVSIQESSSDISNSESNNPDRRHLTPQGGFRQSFQPLLSRLRTRGPNFPGLKSLWPTNNLYTAVLSYR